MKSNILEILKIPEVSTKRHYWIIRTNGGIYYQDFILHEYISISWDYITLNILNNENEDAIKRLIGMYAGNLNEEIDLDDEETDGSSKGKVTAIYNKIHRFVFEISRGDIVLIPSSNSDFITIAEVTGDVYENPNYVETRLLKDPDSETVPCPYYKRRKIRTLKTIEKGKMDIYLTKGFYSQHALSSMDDYAPYIDRTIYGIYSKGDEVHTTIHAGHPNGLTLKELVSLSTLLEESASSLAHQCGIPFDSSDVEVKLNIHSPGLIELIGATSGIGIALSLLIFSINNVINGGKISISFKRDKESGDLDFSVNSESVGLKGHNEDGIRLELQKKKELLEMVAALDIKSPEIISSIINGEKVTTNMISESQKAPTVPKHKIKRHIRFKNNTTNNALPSDSDDAME
jgi:hypothetical protein